MTDIVDLTKRALERKAGEAEIYTRALLSLARHLVTKELRGAKITPEDFDKAVDKLFVDLSLKEKTDSQALTVEFEELIADMKAGKVESANLMDEKTLKALGMLNSANKLRADASSRMKSGLAKNSSSFSLGDIEKKKNAVAPPPTPKKGVFGTALFSNLLQDDVYDPHKGKAGERSAGTFNRNRFKKDESYRDEQKALAGYIQNLGSKASPEEKLLLKEITKQTAILEKSLALQEEYKKNPQERMEDNSKALYEVLKMPFSLFKKKGSSEAETKVEKVETNTPPTAGGDAAVEKANSETAATAVAADKDRDETKAILSRIGDGIDGMKSKLNSNDSWLGKIFKFFSAGNLLKNIGSMLLGLGRLLIPALVGILAPIAVPLLAIAAIGGAIYGVKKWFDSKADEGPEQTPEQLETARKIKEESESPEYKAKMEKERLDRLEKSKKSQPPAVIEKMEKDGYEWSEKGWKKSSAKVEIVKPDTPTMEQELRSDITEGSAKIAELRGEKPRVTDASIEGVPANKAAIVDAKTNEVEQMKKDKEIAQQSNLMSNVINSTKTANVATSLGSKSTWKDGTRNPDNCYARYLDNHVCVY